MDRARIHEGIRRMRFNDILARSERSELSQMEAGELLGISERTFRRCVTATARWGRQVWTTGAWRRRCAARRWPRSNGCWAYIRISIAASPLTHL